MLDYPLVAAIAAVIRTGSFEKAAAELGVTPSAVSQRVRLIEERLGTVLIVRGQPCRGTAAGERIARHAAEVALLERELAAEIGLEAAAPARVRIAVNGDSLVTWFVEAMAGAASGAGEGVLFDVVIDDEAHSADWLRRGEVAAAISTSAAAVQGCDVHPLGALRYRATASPAFCARWFPDGVDAAALARAPSLLYSEKDRLQERFVEALLGAAVPLPAHRLPSSRAFLDAARAGLGWGMNPERLVAHDIAAGRLVDLGPLTPLDVPLAWQTTRIAARALGGLTASVKKAAWAWLVPPDRNAALAT